LPDRLQIGGFDVDHIVPESRGGQTILENLAYAGQSCNGHKWSHEEFIDPATGERVRIFNPRTDRWDDHFQWVESPEELDVRIVGKTSCGRATEAGLQMNAPAIARVRRDLIVLEILKIPDRP
jgi:hypothetical protein